MHFPKSKEQLFTLIAQAADVSMKPWRHAVIENDLAIDNSIDNSSSFDLVIRIEARNQEGDRLQDNDLELEIYTSGDDINLILSWSTKPTKPILWQGKHSVWMDSVSGKRCQAPSDANLLESLARRLRASLSSL